MKKSTEKQSIESIFGNSLHEMEFDICHSAHNNLIKLFAQVAPGYNHDGDLDSSTPPFLSNQLLYQRVHI